MLTQQLNALLQAWCTEKLDLPKMEEFFPATKPLTRRQRQTPLEQLEIVKLMAELSQAARGRRVDNG